MRRSLLVLSLLSIVPVAADELVLEPVIEVSDPLAYDLAKRDRVIPSTCTLADGTTVNAVLRGKPDAPSETVLTITRNEATAEIRVPAAGGSSNRALACAGQTFYFGHPRLGELYAYDADAVLSGKSNQKVWTHELEPFKRIKGEVRDPMNLSLLTSVLFRDGLLLVEWFNRKDGVSMYSHRVLRPDGTVLGTIGPGDLLLKTTDEGPGWALFQGGGFDFNSYVPKRLVRLRFGEPSASARPAQDAARALTAANRAVERTGPVAELPTGRIQQHMVALLTPRRVARDSTIELCPVVPPETAKNWLGSAYDQAASESAKEALLRFAAEQPSAGNQNPLDVWFRAEIADREPMKGVLGRFDPTNDEWIAAYQKALWTLASPTLDQLADRAVSRRSSAIEPHLKPAAPSPPGGG